MPWCEDCSKFWNPNIAAARRHLPDLRRVHRRRAAGQPKVPWHFWILIVALGIYLSWRAFQGIEWLIHR